MVFGFLLFIACVSIGLASVLILTARACFLFLLFHLSLLCHRFTTKLSTVK
jgi:hypothetical protein